MLTLVLILVVVGGGIMFFGFRGVAGDGVGTISVRLGRYGLAAAAQAAVASAPKQRSAVTNAMDKAVARGGLTKPIADRLERADIRITPAEFAAIAALVLVLACVVGLVVKGTLGFLGLGIAGAVAPWIYLRRRTSKRRKAFVEQLADMAQMMGNSMKAGFSIGQSMELVSTEGPAPACHEFDRVVTEVKLGLPLDAALEHLLQRQPSEDLELMVVAINVQRQIGGNLSEILAVISQTIRERVRFARDLQTLTAQARYSSYVITLLPIAVAIVINLMDQPYESFLYTTTLGFVMLGVAITMLGLGFFFLSRIANIEV